MSSPNPPSWLESLSHFAWPVSIILILLLYRGALSKFFAVVSERASEITIGSWASFKLPTLTETPLDQDVSDFRRVEGSLLTESYKTELFKQFRASRKHEYAVINLGEGEEWISSRLYIFAVMLQRMKSLECIVFVYKTAASTSTFPGHRRYRQRSLGVGDAPTVARGSIRESLWKFCPRSQFGRSVCMDYERQGRSTSGSS